MIEENAELPKLPRGWLWTNVGQIYDIVGGGTPSTKVKEYWNGDIPWITSADIRGLKDIQPQRFVTKEGIANSATNLVPERSIIVVTRVGLGKVALAEKPLCFSQDSQALIGSSSLVYPEYALYYLSVAVQIFKYKHRGTTIGGVTKKQLRELLFPLAPYNEQKRIVARLEEFLTRLDGGVEGLQKIRAQLKRYRQAVLKYAFEGKLTEEWRKTHKDQIEPATTLLERIKQERRERLGPKYKELPSIDLSELPELPQSWILVRLGEVADTTSGGTPSRKKKEYYGGRIPWLKSGELKDGVVNVTEESITEDGLANSSTRMIPKGTLLIALYGATVGKLGVLGIDSAINQAICAIFPNNGISRDFLFWYLRKYRDELLNIRKGGAQPNISQDVVRNIVLPLPSIEEQQTIVDEVESRMSLIKEVETVLEKSLKQADRLRQGILKQAFEGKLVPQDPSDEPAEKLLERIKAERAKSKAEKDINKKKIKPKQLELSTYVE